MLDSQQFFRDYKENCMLNNLTKNLVLDDDDDDRAINGVSEMTCKQTSEVPAATPLNSQLNELEAERPRSERIDPNAEVAEMAPPTLSYKVLTYNVWFEESVCMTQRMAEIGNIINAEKADFVFLQEVTLNIEQEFVRAAWFADYRSSGRPARGMHYYTLLLARRDSVTLESPFRRIPFPRSQMGRDVLCICGSVRGHRVLAGTSHLESRTEFSKGPLYNRQLQASATEEEGWRTEGKGGSGEETFLCPSTAVQPYFLPVAALAFFIYCTPHDRQTTRHSLSTVFHLCLPAFFIPGIHHHPPYPI
jgi:hypothetical protein